LACLYHKGKLWLDETVEEMFYFISWLFFKLAKKDIEKFFQE